MRLHRISQWLGAATLMALGACNDLDVENPNAPDATRALADPNAVEAVASGALRTWFDAFSHLSSSGVESAQARSFSASCNNAGSFDQPFRIPRIRKKAYSARAAAKLGSSVKARLIIRNAWSGFEVPTAPNPSARS